VIKRSFDFVLAAVGLILSAPLWMVIPLAVKLEDGGPVLFRQTRVGLDGREFHVLKFRSMVPDAERRFGLVQAREGDPRVTRAGRILRATALDELPQLWNILTGDMSFVGPRALCPGEVEVRGDGRFVLLNAIPGYQERHSVRPGLTGLAQVYASRDIARSSKFRLDLLYVKRGTFFLDLKLIVLSFWITGRAQWETRQRPRSPARASRGAGAGMAGPGVSSAVRREGLEDTQMIELGKPRC
jgi:lipopolysaccharide/colanic/teichoic acid biosynthesis glycosyltransferase